jgi:hypothetical protein
MQKSFYQKINMAGLIVVAPSSLMQSQLPLASPQLFGILQIPAETQMYHTIST